MQVFSEIGQLKKVLLHRPGKELEHLVPEELERLLFDDIPHLKTAQEEHDAFAETLREQGTEVVYLEDLAAQTLAVDRKIKEQFIRQLIQEGGSKAQNFREELFEYLMAIENERNLVLKTMAGISASELGVRNRQPLAELIQRDNRFLLDPIPNLYFTRDPFAVIGKGVSLNHMYSVTRNRETIYAQYILEHHPDLAPGLFFYYRRENFNRIEGGDILVLGKKVIAVGISQRTTPEAIEILARNIFADENCEIETILALDIPNIRAYMHLDTVCTQLDSDKFLVYPGILGNLRIFEVKKGNVRKETGEEGQGIASSGLQAELAVRELEESLTDVLKKYLELDHVTLIKCGGSSRVASEREQWNDGSNTLCVRPGTVIAYDRNHITNDLLRDHGVTVLEIPSSELSRGRGGPRCMSMPLEREDVQVQAHDL